MTKKASEREITKAELNEALIDAYPGDHKAASRLPRYFNRGLRFIVPIPARFGKPTEGETNGGERLLNPETGQPLKKDGPQYGIVIRNPTDGIYQGVRGDGKSTIVIGGDVTPQKAHALQTKLSTLTSGTGNPENFQDVEAVKEFLRYASDDLGLQDMWTGKVEETGRLIPLHKQAGQGTGSNKGGLQEHTGYFTRDPKQSKGVGVIYVSMPGVFLGDVAKGQNYSAANDGFYVTVAERDGLVQYRGVARGAFEADYVDENGNPVNASDVPNYCPNTRKLTLPKARETEECEPNLKQHKLGQPS